jgi:hypothetical protein
MSLPEQDHRVDGMDPQVNRGNVAKSPPRLPGDRGIDEDNNRSEPIDGSHQFTKRDKFASKQRVMDALHDLADRLQFALKEQA